MAVAGSELNEAAGNGLAAGGVEAGGAVQEWLAKRAVVKVEADSRRCCCLLLPWSTRIQLWETVQRQVSPDPVSDKAILLLIL